MFTQHNEADRTTIRNDGRLVAWTILNLSDRDLDAFWPDRAGYELGVSLAYFDMKNEKQSVKG